MFRFTIRDVLWLTVVVAIGAAWWVDRRQLNDLAATWKASSDEYAKILRGEGWFVEGRQETPAERDERFRKLLEPRNAAEGTVLATDETRIYTDGRNHE